MYTKIKYITLLFALMINFHSCDDYVDIMPPGQENAENYFNTPEDYKSALIGVYDLLSTTYLSNILGEIASDNTLCGGESATDVLDWQQIDDMVHNEDNNALRNIWQWMYAGISRANYIVEFKDKIDFEGKEALLAENLFLRSYFYFELVKWFGDVPMYIDGRITIEETQSIDRTPKAEIYSQLEKDLALAATHLPWTQTQKGRATKGAALSLLGKIYLFQEKYSLAAETLDEVIDANQYQLLGDFGTLFLNNNENSLESVFEIQYSGAQDGAGFDCFPCVEGNVASGFMGVRWKSGNYSPYAYGFSFNVPVKELYDQYDEADTRRDNTLFDVQAFIDSRPEDEISITEGNEHTGYFNLKYMPYDEAILADPNINHSNNYRAIRYADVLLMAAEAYNRGGLDDALALNYLNQVRRRAFGDENHDIDSSGAALTADILKERRLELAGEGHRFFDQVRTGNTATIPGFTTNKNELFPIPRIEIELAGNRWEQNPGY